ncbi:MAG TPA: efflux RND transporter periplasmic adaptor subunit [Rhodocyclaceae bacterium]|nr:efflux RND transporter periplasmic adaptor subunit [Rhodocyclaceae bacterium]
MSQNRHSSIGIHGQPAGAKGIHRLRLLKSTQKYALGVLVVLGIGAAIVIGLRVAKAAALAETSREQATRYVNVVTPKPAPADSQLRLPGTLQGIIEAPIYARTNGYLSRWYKDIGDTVKQGDLLAQIDTPEVAQQLIEAKSNQQLAQSTFERYDALQKRDAVSRQEFEEKKNTLATATATVKRLQEQLGYSRIVAPFSGVITRRNVDIGNLVDAGSGTKLLFTLAKTDALRVYVYVPQNYAAQIKAGNKAVVSLKESPGQTFDASIVRTAGAIDTTTRTLQVEVNLPNKEGKLLPGAYVQVAIKAKGGEASSLTVPSNTLLFRPEGPRVAVVDANGKVKLQPVVIGRELGVDIELASGVKVGDQLIINPSDSLNDGDAVSVVAAKDKDAKPADKAKGAAS